MYLKTEAFGHNRIFEERMCILVLCTFALVIELIPVNNLNYRSVTTYGCMACLAFSLLACEQNTPNLDPEPEETSKTVLLFVPQGDSYYTEYIISSEALKAAGYDVEVVSGAEGDATVYLQPAGSTVVDAANALGVGQYEAFKDQFKAMFGEDWNETLNDLPADSKIPVTTSLQSIPDMKSYCGIVITGGTGILNYRTDGLYESHFGQSAVQLELVSQKLNELAVDALKSGKPVLAQCHGASLPVFWNLDQPATNLLSGELAAGYPEATTESVYASRGVTLRPDDKVVIASAHSSMPGAENARYKVITSRDWYPQTVAHATRTFINVLRTYPETSERQTQKKVLLIHGGVVDPSNCSPANLANDVPCNYGGGDNLPADYRSIETMLLTDFGDEYAFTITNVNLSDNTPLTSSQQAIVQYLNTFDAVIFFKHWSTHITTNLEQALVEYVEDGGGLLALHHASYNHVDGSQNKDILLSQLVGSTSQADTWSATKTNYRMISTNYGHFVSSYMIPTIDLATLPSSWSNQSVSNGANSSLTVYPAYPMYDEIYLNKVFYNTATFGIAENDITPLFSNDLPGEQANTEGFVRIVNKNNDNKAGRVAFFQPGEVPANFSSTSWYAQVIRNATVWVSLGK